MSYGHSGDTDNHKRSLVRLSLFANIFVTFSNSLCGKSKTLIRGFKSLLRHIYLSIYFYFYFFFYFIYLFLFNVKVFFVVIFVLLCVVSVNVNSVNILIDNIAVFVCVLRIN